MSEELKKESDDSACKNGNGAKRFVMLILAAPLFVGKQLFGAVKIVLKVLWWTVKTFFKVLWWIVRRLNFSSYSWRG